MNKDFDLAGALIHGDCYRVLPTLPPECVDVVFTDPPYGQSHEFYDAGTRVEVWRECWRMARPTACLLAFAGNPTYHRLAGQIEAAGWHVRQMWAWVYPDGLIQSSRPRDGFDKLAPAFTPLVFATKGTPILPLQKEGQESWVSGRGRSRFSDRSDTPDGTSGVGYWPRNLVATGDVEAFQFFLLRHSQIKGRAPGEERHPNAKPLEVVVHFLSKLPGRVVLDPFMGGGAIGKASQHLGRSYVGIEQSAGYFAMAGRWLAEGSS